MILKTEIEKLAELARIEVTNAEVEDLQKDLERVLSYANELNRAEIGAIEPLSHVTGAHTVLRLDGEDCAVESEPAALLEAAPSVANGYAAVPPLWKRK